MSDTEKTPSAEATQWTWRRPQGQGKGSVPRGSSHSSKRAAGLGGGPHENITANVNPLMEPL